LSATHWQYALTESRQVNVPAFADAGVVRNAPPPRATARDAIVRLLRVIAVLLLYGGLKRTDMNRRDTVNTSPDV
jgi:hypothetical protein